MFFVTSKPELPAPRAPPPPSRALGVMSKIISTLLMTRARERRGLGGGGAKISRFKRRKWGEERKFKEWGKLHAGKERDHLKVNIVIHITFRLSKFKVGHLDDIHRIQKSDLNKQKLGNGKHDRCSFGGWVSYLSYINFYSKHEIPKNAHLDIYIYACLQASTHIY